MKFCHSALCVGVSLWLLMPLGLEAADSGRSGFARSNNFTILTPRQPTAEEANAYAEDILTTAERLRAQIARDWLGGELPDRQGRTVVTVSWDPVRDAGLTWAKDDPRRQLHALYLATSPDASPETTLAHEMVHVVLATAFPHPNRLPTWLEEGIACQYDDPGRERERRQQVAIWNRAGRWPHIERVLNAENIRASDRSSYTVAATLTTLLLKHNSDRQQLLAFGACGARYGWDAALQRYYDIPDVDQLQSLWQTELVAMWR